MLIQQLTTYIVSNALSVVIMTLEFCSIGLVRTSNGDRGRRIGRDNNKKKGRETKFLQMDVFIELDTG